MTRLLITRRAFRDLAQIWLYIATDSDSAADRVREELISEMKRLAEMPGMGHQRSDVSNTTYRFWRVYSYIIAYRVQGERLYVSRVLHGAQDFRRVFNTGSRRRRRR
jgi:plasmid stabilization system protein ParE